MTRGIKECFRNMSYFMQIILLLFSLIMLWFLNKEVLFITFVGGVLTYVSTFGNNITDSFFPCWFLNVHMFTPLLASVKTNEQFHISIVKIIHISNSVPLFLRCFIRTDLLIGYLACLYGLILQVQFWGVLGWKSISVKLRNLEKKKRKKKHLLYQNMEIHSQYN